ncbi:uncharacterized protein EAF01_010624 [Botrytis porri]|uniref:Uncharacterized protein n=1 Tax=Botrytis porri TaxID=87229 RepID=A0A4Z1KUW8_9HELO|nr:uncharacterized protein EAF01_010624 [Botrytis porri]KAF7890815.1 hypothetical protein EAF01_010624 [Botrytis porri]TGO88317.1 hypothetical protein BPOR_0170g00090 [Botrytis porri]
MFSFLIILFLIAGICMADVSNIKTPATPGCNADNCYRAVSGDFRGPFQQAIAYDDCIEYMENFCTVDIINITVTSTILTTITEAFTVGKRAVATTTFSLPSYASACSNEARYSSACSCWGILPDTITKTVPTYTTFTTSTVTTGLPPVCPTGKALMKDALNCGSCGYVCDTGYCEHGTCNTIPCTPNKCEEGIKPCAVDSTCFCFNTITGLGFCGENVGCAEAKDCYDDGDCPNAYVCAWDTCCGNNVCVLGNCPNPAASLIRSVQRKRDALIGDTAAYRAD